MINKGFNKYIWLACLIIIRSINQTWNHHKKYSFKLGKLIYNNYKTKIEFVYKGKIVIKVTIKCCHDINESLINLKLFNTIPILNNIEMNIDLNKNI